MNAPYPPARRERQSPIPVTVLSGALGAGKTTLLNAALRGVLGNVAVVVNEFGAIGIDNDLIETASEDVVLLPGGCVCCQVRADLAVALLQLERGAALGQHPGFERVIVETSGLAEPGPILQLFAESPALAGRFRLDALVVVIDAQFGAAALADDTPAYRQALLADRLIISKSELVDVPWLQEIEARLSVINPAAACLRAPRGEARAAWFEPVPLLPARVVDGASWRAQHDDAVESFILQWQDAQPLAVLGDWLHGLAGHFGARLLRVKGIVRITADHPTGDAAAQSAPELADASVVALHVIQHIVAAPEFLAIPATTSRVVFITRGLEPGDVAPPWQYEVACATPAHPAPAAPTRLPQLQAVGACDARVPP